LCVGEWGVAGSLASDGGIKPESRACAAKENKHLRRSHWQLSDQCDAPEAIQYASSASIPPSIRPCKLPIGRPKNKNGSPAKPRSHKNPCWILFP
jgi:hypothetical protein